MSAEEEQREMVTTPLGTLPLDQETLEAAAWEAVDHGWWIFPCKPNGKQPLTRHGFYDAQDDVRHWPENANVGIACGHSGLLVVDMDVKNGVDGITAFETWAGEWPDTFEVETPSGGVHLYFNHPDNEFGNSTGTLPKGIDIRGVGGYVLGAGSLIDGDRYLIANDADVAPIPTYLAMALKEPRQRTRRVRQRSRRHNQWETMPRWQAEEMLNKFLDMVAESLPGGRNNILFWAACRFGEALDSGWLDEETVETALLGVARECGLVRDDGEEKILGTIYSGLDTGRAGGKDD